MRWAPPTPRRLEILAENLREQDRIEVMASDGLDAWEAVYSSWRASQVCECIDGDDGEVVGVCGVSGEVLAEIAEPLRAIPAPQLDILSVTDLLDELRRPDSSPSLEGLMPFALNHLHRHGSRQFVEATYETLFGRWPDANAAQPNERLADDEKRVATYLRLLMKSEEYTRRWGVQIPGPFHPSFRYDRSGLV